MSALAKCYRCDVEPQIERRLQGSGGTEQAVCGSCSMASPEAADLEPRTMSRADCYEAVAAEWRRMQSALAPRERFVSLRGRAV